MANVAVNGSQIAEAVVPNYVTYSIERWVAGYCNAYDEFGECVDWVSGRWVSDGSGSTNAKITGYVSAPSSKIKIQGNNVAKVGDKTIESWEASPPIPSSTSTRRYTATSDTSGSGQGTITGGSVTGKLGGQAIALVGSEVTTSLGVTTTISNGNSKMKFNS